MCDAITQALASLIGTPPWDKFAPPMVGSFLGVFTGFGINYLALRIKAWNDKKYYKIMLKTEIMECYESCERLIEDSENTRDFGPLPIDRWTAAMNSGALRLFNVDELNALSRIYHIIKKYNFVVENFHIFCPEVAIQELETEGTDLLAEIRERLTVDWLIPSPTAIHMQIIRADEAGAYLK